MARDMSAMLAVRSPNGQRQQPRIRQMCNVSIPRALRPNPSVNRSANGRPPSPGRWYAVHFHRPGLGVLPSSPGYLERYACGTAELTASARLAPGGSPCSTWLRASAAFVARVLSCASGRAASLKCRSSTRASRMRLTGTRNAARRAFAPQALRLTRRHNTSLKRSANGMPPGPAGSAVHCLPSGPGVLPSSPA